MRKGITIALGLVCLLLLSSCGDTANQSDIPEQDTVPVVETTEQIPSETPNSTEDKLDQKPVSPEQPTPEASGEQEKEPEPTPTASTEAAPPEVSTQPAHQHTYTATVVAPTMDAEGYTLHTCDCGDSHKDNYIEKLPAEGRWSQADLDTAAKLGILPAGFADNTTQTVTVCEVIAVAAQVHSVYYNQPLPSDPSQQAYVEYAIENGIIGSTDFSAYDRPATRREAAYIFSRTVPSAALAKKNTVVFSAIPDVTMAEQYGEAIYTLYRAGITVGVDKTGTFCPDATLSHGWTAAMALRLLDQTVRETIALAEAADQPDTFKRGEERGVTTIYCAYSPLYKEYTSVPLASGLPKLTNEEIDWLIATEDYALIADSISTWADCANYFLRAGFEEKSSDIDVPGLTWCGHICGQQVMARRGGACGGMSNAAAYILRDDYEELGYIHQDHHIQLYLLIDGLYYVMDPVHYLGDSRGHIPQGWFAGRCPGATICADSLQKIADGWVASGWVTEHFYTFVSPGDHFPYMMISETPDIWMYPNGTHVNVWFGPDVVYGEPGDKCSYEKDGKPTEWFVIQPFNIDWTTGTDWVDESLIKSR